MNPVIHYEFQSLVFMAMIDPVNFGGRDNLVLAVQRQGIMKKDGSTPTTTVSVQPAE